MVLPNMQYIYQQRNSQFIAGAPVLHTRQPDAIFMGFESKLSLPLYGIVDFTLFSDYTWSQFINCGDVPGMTPLLFGFQIDHLKRKWSYSCPLMSLNLI
jgi:hypothetical protein